LEKDPGTKKAYRNWAFVLNRMGRHDEATEVVRLGLGLQNLIPEHRASLLYERSLAYFNLKRYDEAFNDIQAALLLQPRSPKLLYFRARMREYRGESSEAQHDAREVLKQIPDHTGALRIVGEYL
jgi:tetratricopeptide (TPR) repeat protein